MPMRRCFGGQAPLARPWRIEGMYRPRISFVAPHLYPVLTGARGPLSAGGAEVQQTMIIRALQSRGHSICVVTGDFGQDDVVHWNGIRIDKMPAPRGRGIKGLRFVHPRLTDCVAALRRQRPEIVYNRVAGAYLAACAWYCRRDGAQLIYASASDADFRPGHNPDLSHRDEWLFRWGLRRVEKVLLQNRVQQQQWCTVSSAPAVLLPNAYAEDHTCEASFAGPVLFVGSIKPMKRPEHFLSLAAALPHRRFKMIGPPEPGAAGLAYERHIEQLARRYANVEYLGFVPFDEIGRHFDGASLLVNTSEVEGFPNTFLQAWIRGVASLSYVAPETASGTTGTISVDSQHALLEAARELLSDVERWRGASRQCLQHFQRHHALARVAELYDSVFCSP
jgi:glycosyltransferase involved in cell wall biosynthesis